jgi:competence protein ComEA
MMTIFTSQERMVIQFLMISIAIGLVTGVVRKMYFSPDFSEQIEKDIELFRNTTETIINSHSSMSENASTKTDDIEDEKSVKSLDINTAKKSDLLTLPKVGPVTAERIIRYRDDYGPFKSIDDLLNIKGIGSKTLEKMKPLITVGTNGK